MGTEIVKSNGSGGQQAGTIARQEFGAQSLARSAELATAAVAAQAKAEVEARYVMALQRPRDLDDVRARFLRECRRPGFARVARYSKPVGKSRIEGPSIRFVEAAMRCMGNIIAPTSVVYEDRERRIVRVAVTDLEANVTYPTDIVVEKTVERKKSEGREVVGERVNTYGETVYIVLATDDELLNKQAALVSKAVRTAGLRLLPGDLVDEGEDECIHTLRDAAAADPDAEKKKILDAFGAIGVPPAELKKYLGHPLDQVVPAELVELRHVYSAIKDGEATWAATIEEKLGRPAETGTAPPVAAAAAASLVNAAEQAQNAPATGAAPTTEPSPAPALGGPLDKALEAIAKAKVQKDLLAAMKLVNALPADQQPAAREAFNAKTEEIANAAA